MFLNILDWGKIRPAGHCQALCWVNLEIVAMHGFFWKAQLQAIRASSLLAFISESTLSCMCGTTLWQQIGTSGTDKWWHIHSSEGKQMRYWWPGKRKIQQISLRSCCNSATSWDSTAVHRGLGGVAGRMAQSSPNCCAALLSLESLSLFLLCVSSAAMVPLLLTLPEQTRHMRWGKFSMCLNTHRKPTLSCGLPVQRIKGWSWDFEAWC